MSAAAFVRGAGHVLLGLVVWPFLLPLGVKRLYRVSRRLVRKLAKPALLWLNAWRFWMSEREVYRLTTTADSLRQAAGREAVRQVKLQEQRRRINGW